MKKILLALTFFILTINTSFGEGGDCSVKSGPSEGIKKYISDIKNIESLITSESSKYSCKSTGTGILDSVAGQSSKAFNSIVSDFNDVVNFDGFFSSWEFNLYPVFNGNFPNEFYRDHDFINNQSDKLDSLTKAVSKKCALDKTYNTSSVNDILKKYNFDSSTIGKTLSSLRKFNSSVTIYFRCVSVGSFGGSCTLDNQELKDDIAKNYNKDAKQVCVEGSKTWKKMMEDIAKITKEPFGFSAISKGIKEWKKAFELLNGYGIDGKTYSQIEKDLLSAELSRQGLNASQAQVILNNLDCVNNSKDGIISCIGDRIKSIYQPFIDVVISIKNDIVGTAKNTVEPSRQLKQTKSLQYIFTEINSDYSAKSKLINIESKTSEKEIAQIIQLHENLIGTNKTLQEARKIAREACNCQAQGVGNCD